jgi:hypothetical protein
LILRLLKRFTNSGSGGPVRQPYSYLVPAPIYCPKISAQGTITNVCMSQVQVSNMGGGGCPQQNSQNFAGNFWKAEIFCPCLLELIFPSTVSEILSFYSYNRISWLHFASSAVHSLQQCSRPVTFWHGSGSGSLDPYT